MEAGLLGALRLRDEIAGGELLGGQEVADLHVRRATRDHGGSRTVDRVPAAENHHRTKAA